MLLLCQEEKHQISLQGRGDMLGIGGREETGQAENQRAGMMGKMVF